MKRMLLAFAISLCAAPALAEVAPSWPARIEEAPIERAIENVEDDRTLTAAQRERILGRLHLVAYAQGAVQMARHSNGVWVPDGEGSLRYGRSSAVRK